MVDQNAALGLIDELRVAVPEEVRAAKRINSEGERIIEKAQDEAERIVAKAQEQAAFLIDERGLMNVADQGGNAQFLGPDLYFDDLFLGAAKGESARVDADARRRQQPCPRRLHQVQLPASACEDPVCSVYEPGVALIVLGVGTLLYALVTVVEVFE